MQLAQMSQADSIQAYFVVGGGLLLATFALSATARGIWEVLEWPPAFMVGAIHVDLLAFNRPLLDRFSFSISSEFLALLLAFHALALMVTIQVRNRYMSSGQGNADELLNFSYSNPPLFIRPLMVALGGVCYSVLFFFV